VLGTLGSEKVYVVHGSDGSDEVTVTGATRVTLLDDGRVETFMFAPESVGIERTNPRALTGGTPEENAATIVAILDGARGAKRDAVVLNAGFVIAVAGRANSIVDGVAMAAASIDEGRAKDVLERLRATTRELAVA
jgi:anthranilate phosphoribosyltransferase